MSDLRTTIRPYRVGHESVLVVGMEGVVEAITDDGITIGGITLPNRLDHDRGVRYVSMVWPEGDETTCSRDHCDGGCHQPAADEDDARESLDTLERMIRDEHEGHHPGSMRFCDHAICREVST